MEDVVQDVGLYRLVWRALDYLDEMQRELREAAKVDLCDFSLTSKDDSAARWKSQRCCSSKTLFEYLDIGTFCFVSN